MLEHSFEIYGGLVAIIFAALGIWLGLRLTGPRQRVVVKEVLSPPAEPFVPDERKRETWASPAARWRSWPWSPRA